MASDNFDAEETEIDDEFDLPGGKAEVALRTTGDIQREMARLYRATKAKRIPVGLCNCLTQTLVYLQKVTAEATAEDVLKRLEALEARH